MMNHNTCPSCRQVYEGKYCPNCGQKLIQVPITFKSVLGSVAEIVDFNKGFFFTFYVLLVRPGSFVREYLNGSTNRYFGPLKFMVTLVTLGIIFNYFRTSGTDNFGEFDFLLSPYAGWVIIYSTIFNFIFFRSDFSFVEHIVIAVYLSAMVFGLASVGLLFFLTLESDNANLFALLIALSLFIYAVWFDLDVFKRRKTFSFLIAFLYLVIGLTVPLLFWSFFSKP